MMFRQDERNILVKTEKNKMLLQNELKKEIPLVLSVYFHQSRRKNNMTHS